MQTFLPYSDFKRSVECLDNKRLGKQRVEAFQIIKVIIGERTSGGFVNHPIMKMWKGYSNALMLYKNLCIEEWIKRGFNNNMEISNIEGKEDITMPLWLGDERLHSSHRANLLRKDYQFYSKYDWKEKDMNYEFIDYYWCNEYWSNKGDTIKSQKFKKIYKMKKN